jgi:hypothetical protein
MWSMTHSELKPADSPARARATTWLNSSASGTPKVKLGNCNPKLIMASSQVHLQ